MRFPVAATLTTGLLACKVHGAVTSLSPKVPNPYVVSSASTIDLSFITSLTILPTEDYSVVFGIYPASSAVAKNLIGIRWSNVDLVAAGHSITGGGSFTLTKLPLTTKYFPKAPTTPTPYVIAAAVTTGTGTTTGGNAVASVQVFSVPVNITSAVFTTNL